MELPEIRWEVVNWIHLAQDMFQWRTPLNTMMNFRVSKSQEISCIAERVLAS
jgi:hypothetical protein